MCIYYAARLVKVKEETMKIEVSDEVAAQLIKLGKALESEMAKKKYVESLGEKVFTSHLARVFGEAFGVKKKTWASQLFLTVSHEQCDVVHGFNAVQIEPGLINVMRDRYAKRIYVYDYEFTIEWRDDEERDSRIVDSLISRVKDGAARLADFDEMALHDLINGSATYLHPSTDFNCHDSLPLYSASHATRSGGNIVTGSGVASTSAIKADWFKVLQAFREMIGRQWDDARFLVVAPPQLKEVMANAFDAHSQNAELVIWERLSNNDWYVFLVGGAAVPLIKLARSGTKQREWNFENSEWASKTRMKGIGWDLRVGYGALNFSATVKVHN